MPYSGQMMTDDFTTRVTLRIPQDVWNQVKEAATKNVRSANWEAVNRLRRSLEGDK